MARHGDNISFGVKPAHPRSHKNSTDESGDTTDHVHNGASGKVDYTHVKECTEPTSAPHPMRNNGVYEGGQEERIAEICVE
mmetsp:Transcript_16139/g.66705  ORF Transcript_16139/g.66705 Transcript_16139/m.66705 type:complete len:81 (+) Transcript_16139:914-1156(+)